MWRSTTLLLIDDSELFQYEVIRFIEKFGAGVQVVGTANSGRLGVTEARKLGPHVILLDLNMPGLDGLETISMLRDVGDAAIIVVSIWDDDSRRERAIAAGADDFVGKSRISTDLLPAIERARSKYSTLRR